MARPATNKSIPDTMMRAGSRATCSTRFGSRPRLTSVEAPSATNVGPTNAAMDFDAVALSTLKTPAGFLLSLLFCRSVAHLPAFEKLGGAHESAAMLINRANDWAAERGFRASSHCSDP